MGCENSPGEPGLPTYTALYRKFILKDDKEVEYAGK